MSFQETSNAIWDSMNGNSPFNEGKRDTGPYTADFYGMEEGAIVDFEKLEDFISDLFLSGKDQFFDYRKFGTNENYWKKEQEQYVNPSYIRNGNASFTYRLADRKKKETLRMLILLNRRNDFVNNDYSTRADFRIMFNQVKGIFTLRFYYAGTNNQRREITSTEDEGDFTIDDKFVAIEFQMRSFSALYHLCKRLLPDNGLSHFLDIYASKYTQLIKSASNTDDLATYYADIPKELQSRIKNKLSIKRLMSDLNTIRLSDESSILYDTSHAMLSILELAIAKDHERVFEFLKKFPSFIKYLYFNMHGTTTLGDQEVECRFAFVSLLMGLCFLNGFEGLKITKHQYKVGKMYEPDSNIQVQEDKSPDVIYLRPYKSYVRKTNWFEEIYNPWGFVVDETATGKGHWYHPLDMIVMIDEDSPDKTTMLVPAIFVKYFADAKEWEDVLRVVKLIVDVLLIVLSVVTLGSSSMLLFVFSVADLALATTDFLITLNSDVLMQTPEGEAFLKIWQKISLIGGLALAAPFLIVTAFRTGLTLLLKATSAETKNLIRSSLIAIIMHRNIYLKLEKHTLELFITEIDTMKAFNYTIKSSQINTLMDNGVLFMKGDVMLDKVIIKDQYLLIYDGKIIAAGDAQAIRETIEKLCKLKKTNLAEELGELAKKDVKSVQKFNPKKLYAKKRKFAEINPKAKRDLNDHKAKRAAYHQEGLVKNLWPEKIKHVAMSDADVLEFYHEIIAVQKNLDQGFNFATFITTIKRNKKSLERVSEFAISSDKNKILRELGSNPKLPDNNIDIMHDSNLLKDYDEFSEKAVDFKIDPIPRMYDSELKYIFNFLRKHIHKGDEFIIEVKTLLRPCDSCKREFIMLEELMRKHRKKVTFVMHYNDNMVSIKNVKELLNK